MVPRGGSPTRTPHVSPGVLPQPRSSAGRGMTMLHQLATGTVPLSRMPPFRRSWKYSAVEPWGFLLRNGHVGGSLLGAAHPHVKGAVLVGSSGATVDPGVPDRVGGSIARSRSQEDELAATIGLLGDVGKGSVAVQA